MSNWNIKSPNVAGDYICRMNNGYIKMCHWDNVDWFDMWETGIIGIVKEWMYIPYDK